MQVAGENIKAVTPAFPLSSGIIRTMRRCRGRIEKGFRHENEVEFGIALPLDGKGRRTTKERSPR
jgi:hypothetical protein